MKNSLYGTRDSLPFTRKSRSPSLPLLTVSLKVMRSCLYTFSTTSAEGDPQVYPLKEVRSRVLNSLGHRHEPFDKRSESYA
jgi:hypothetical protein